MGSTFSDRCTPPGDGSKATISGGKSGAFWGEAETRVGLDCEVQLDALPAPAPEWKPIEPRGNEWKGQNRKKSHRVRTRFPPCGVNIKQDPNTGVRKA